MKRIGSFVKVGKIFRTTSMPWLAGLLSLLGGCVYFLQSIVYAHTLASMVDEAAYLYKGYLYATGKYVPFQAYGPWTNKAPLSFLIYGYVQTWFGPGLRTGRYFAVFIGLLMLLGLWIIARRLGGRWWAAIAVWTVTANPWLIKTYSLASSQVLVACLLTWTMVLILGTKQTLWQIVLGGILSGITVMTRQNLLPVIPLLIIYVFWQYGCKAGILTTLASGAVIVGIHALFWPNILQMWAPWLPKSLTPFLDPWREPPGAAPAWNPDMSISARLLSFFQGFRFNFIATVGITIAWLLWTRKGKWTSEFAFRSSVFISILFGVLWLTHAWAALANNYCVFCYPEYISFWGTLGIVMLVVSFRSWEKKHSGLRTIVVLLALVTLASGLGYSAYEDFSFENIQNSILNAYIPRIRNYHFLPGKVSLWMVLANKFGWNYGDSYELLRRLIPSAIGLGIGIVILLVSVIFYIALKKRYSHKYSFEYLVALILLISGTLLSPSQILGGGHHNYDCGEDVIVAYESAGVQLASLIPPGKRVYWEGSQSITILLYLKDAVIYPPQLNSIYNFRLGGDSMALLRLGLWNDVLANQWLSQADVILVENTTVDFKYLASLQNMLDTGHLIELPPMSPPVSCRRDPQIRIFEKTP